MSDITFKFSGTLIAEPRASQLTTESIREHSPDYKGQKTGLDSTDTRYTYLRFRCSEDEWTEVSVRGPLAERLADEVEVGTEYEVKGRVHSRAEYGHFILRATSVKAKVRA